MGKSRCGVSTNRLRARPGQHHWPSSFSFHLFHVIVAPLGHSKLGSHVLKILPAEMPTMSGRVRPIEKFAEAVGKCSVEVRSRVSTLYRWTGTDFALRLRHTANVSLQTISQSIKTCVRKNLCASKIVIWYVHPRCDEYFIAHLWFY